MTNAIDILIVLLILTNLMILGSSRLRTCIFVVAIQGILLGILTVFMKETGITLHMLIIACFIIGIKGLIFPMLLFNTLRDLYIQYEIEPYIGYGASLVMSPAVLMLCIWLGDRLPLPVGVSSSLLVPTAFFTITCGLFLIVSRKKALTQILGYLVLENGIYVFGASLVTAQPVLVELGILMDAFVAVIVMGIAVYQINREFDHTNIDQLDGLKG